MDSVKTHIVEILPEYNIIQFRFISPDNSILIESLSSDELLKLLKKNFLSDIDKGDDLYRKHPLTIKECHKTI